MTDTATAIACPFTACGTTAPDTGTLAGHLAEDHLVSASQAFQMARDAAGKPYVPPTLPIVLSPPPVLLRVAPQHGGANGNGNADAEATATEVATPKGALMATKPHRADPAACKLCARVAPDKCRRHGGPSHSTSYGGVKQIRGPRDGCSKCHRRVGHSPKCPRKDGPDPKPTPTPKPGTVDGAIAAAVAWLDREIETRETQLATLKDTRSRLAALL